MDWSVFNTKYDLKTPLPEKKWKTRDGREIAVKDMGTNHILNAYRYVKNNKPHPTRVVLPLGYTTFNIDCCSGDIEEKPNPLYREQIAKYSYWCSAFEKELKNRNVEIPEIQEVSYPEIYKTELR